MSAVDEIQAAIEKLTALKFGSSVRPWLAEPYTYGIQDATQRVRITSAGDSDEYNTAEGVLPVDARLIVTLHATIDAQLAILNHAYGQLKDGYSPDEPGATEDALDLARAINGGAS